MKIHPCLCTIICLLISISTAASAQVRKKLDRVISRFEQEHSRSAVVIIKARTAEIVYTYNREWALRRRFPPGSIAKVWSAIILLDNAPAFRFNPHRTTTCDGKYYIPRNLKLTDSDNRLFNLPRESRSNRRYFRCSRIHGEMDLTGALIYSCNVYFLTWSSSRPYQFHRLLMDVWHLNEATGARLTGITELPGRSIRRLSKLNASVSAIGEGTGIRVSPLKVAQTFSAIFEHTPLLCPFDRPGTRVRAQYPLPLSWKTRSTIISALSRVVSSGTLKKLQVANPSVTIVAGKTGTATQHHKKYATHGWNVIYIKNRGVPCVLCVFVEKGSGGNEARKLSMRILNAL